MTKNTSILWAALFAVSGIIPCQAGLIDDKRNIFNLEAKAADLRDDIVNLLNDLNRSTKYKPLNPQDYDSELVATVAKRVAQREAEIERISDKITEISNETNTLQSRYSEYTEENTSMQEFLASLELEAKGLKNRLAKLKAAVAIAKENLANDETSSGTNSSTENTNNTSQSSPAYPGISDF